MKFSLFGHTIILDSYLNRPDATEPLIVGDIYSESRHRRVGLNEMSLDWIRNALLKRLNKTDWKGLASETIVKNLEGCTFVDSETFSLYCELKRRVEKGRRI
jgi:hypothetical protein